MVASYARQPADDLYLTNTGVAEPAFGIELIPAGRRRRSLESWLRGPVMGAFHGRILPFDQDAAPVYGRLMATARRQEHPARVGEADIAAVAICDGFVVATRNFGDFTVFGVPLVDPWQE